MALSHDEIHVLNEIARGTAEEDPAYTRRMMTYERPKGARRSRAGSRRTRRAGRRPARVNLPVYVPSDMRTVHSPRPLLPTLLLGLFLIVALLAVFGVLVRGVDHTHARSVSNESSQVR
jgi:hypothetical protein